MIFADHLSRSFGSVQVIDDLSLSFKSGEVVALMGGNGAGKSTLLRMLSGALKPSTGFVRAEWSDSPLRSISQARQAGVWMSDQEGALIPDWSVREHFSLLAGLRGQEPWRELAPHVIGSTLVQNLPQQARQLVEIALTFAGGTRAILLDEPTAGLASDIKRQIFAIMRKAAAKGATVVWVTHDVGSALEVADRIVVLRDRQIVCDCSASELLPESLFNFLISEQAARATRKKDIDQRPGVNCVTLTSRVGTSFVVGQGEIVGLAGSAQSGTRDMLRAAAGLMPGGAYPKLDPAPGFSLPFAYMSREREGEWDFTGQSLRFCLTASAWPQLANAGWIFRTAEDALANQLRDVYSISAPSLDVPIETLSGGNRQKALLARLASTNPPIMVLDEPFSGIDAPTRIALRGEIRKLARHSAIIIYSQEWADMIEAVDRLLILRDDGAAIEIEGEAMSCAAVEQFLSRTDAQTSEVIHA